MFSDLIPPGQTAMGNLGVFGETAADEGVDREGKELGGMGGGGIGGGATFGAQTGVPRMRALGAMNKSMAGVPPMALAAEAPAPTTPSSGDAAAQALVEPTVRTNFADSALWVGAITTDENGLAQSSLTMPENLTTWKVRAWSMGHGTKVGQGDAEVVTRKNLIVRLEGPRFFVEKDEVVLSANVHNYLKTAKTATVSLELEGKCLTPLDDLTRKIEVAQ